MELTDDERLALLEAMSKQIKEPLANAKADAKYHLTEAMDAFGADRKAVMVNGEKVGEVGVSYSTPKPMIMPGKEEEALAFLEEMGLTERVPVTGWEKHFSQVGTSVVHSESGAVCDAMVWEPRRPKNAAVRGCKPEDVFPAIQAKLGGQSVLALLQEGDI